MEELKGDELPHAPMPEPIVAQSAIGLKVKASVKKKRPLHDKDRNQYDDQNDRDRPLRLP